MRYFFLLMIVVLFGCHQPEKKAVAKNKLTSNDSTRIETRKNEVADSIIQVKLLDAALKYATINLRQNYYQKKIYLNQDTSKNAVLQYGHLFGNNVKHLLLKTNSSWNINTRIFVFDNGNLKQVLSQTEWDLNFVADTIRDVNGDGFKDFISITYSSSGCCARSYNNVSLYEPAQGAFSKSYFFINPDFFPKEKVIRGVNYGHPGEVPLYKYKWNGANIDTVEYIYPADTLKKKFYLVHHYGDKDNPQKRKTLSAVPKEYLKISGYDWFIDY
nr:hypothetical protein [Mucilaginibacter sp. L294]